MLAGATRRVEERKASAGRGRARGRRGGGTTAKKVANAAVAAKKEARADRREECALEEVGKDKGEGAAEGE